MSEVQWAHFNGDEKVRTRNWWWDLGSLFDERDAEVIGGIDARPGWCCCCICIWWWSRSRSPLSSDKLDLDELSSTSPSSDSMEPPPPRATKDDSLRNCSKKDIWDGGRSKTSNENVQTISTWISLIRNSSLELSESRQILVVTSLVNVYWYWIPYLLNFLVV